MIFKEAYDLYKRGFKVRRSSWRNKEYWLGKLTCEECGCEIDFEDAVGDDWEVIVSSNK